MSTSDENIKIDHNIPVSSSINAVSNDVCKLAVSVDDEMKPSAEHNVLNFGIERCANCGKEGSYIDMNTCNKCKMVKYCNAACKKKHRHKHKKQCEEHIRLTTELAKLHYDKKLFKQPPPAEDCPICFQRLPTLVGSAKTMACCGKQICNGCCYAPVYDHQGNEVDEKKCPFCRSPHPTHDEATKLNMKRVELGDARAIQNLGFYYFKGLRGYPQDYNKGFELWHRAGELGNAVAYYSIGVAYDMGVGVERDEKKAVYYYELAAIGGDTTARHNLGIKEKRGGNMDRALKHYMIAVRGGNSGSLNQIQELYSLDLATKEDYTEALRAYQEYLVEIKSVQRDKAAAADEEKCRYY